MGAVGEGGGGGGGGAGFFPHAPRNMIVPSVNKVHHLLIVVDVACFTGFLLFFCAPALWLALQICGRAHTGPAAKLCSTNCLH